MTKAVILGIDPQPKRLGLALIDADTGEPLRAWVEPLDVDGGGWPHQQIANALRTVDESYIKDVKTCEPVAIGIEDAQQGALSRAHVASHAYTLALVEAECRRRWPWCEDRIRLWHPGKGGRDSTPKSAPYLWKVWAEVVWPREKHAVSVRAMDMGFRLPDGKHRQDAADAACIALATRQLWYSEELGIAA